MGHSVSVRAHDPGRYYPGWGEPWGVGVGKAMKGRGRRKERAEEWGGKIKHLENYCSLRALDASKPDESSAGCLGNGYFPSAADQFHLHKCPMKL